MKRLADRLQQEIQEKGPMRFDHFMAAALGDPTGGYYMTHDPLGLAGDFVTSPEISQIFGEMIGIWCAEFWQRIGCPKEMHLVELGPGRGTLMNDLLRATCHVAHFHDAITVHLVEMSPTLTAVQKQTLSGKHPNIHWHETIPSFDAPVLMVANEFFDALPIRQFVTSKSGFAEKMVVWDAQKQTFAFELSEPGHHLPTAYPDIKPTQLAEGSVIEICEAAQHIMRDLSAQFTTHGGGILAIDYGFVRPAADSGEVAVGDSLQAVRRHQHQAVLENPGMSDITAHVDFSTLAEIATEAGAHASPIITQHEFLHRMGGKLRLEQLMKQAEDQEQVKRLIASYERLVSEDEMGKLFKVMAVTHPEQLPPIF